jgi:serine/threonine-protein kinase ATR
LVSNDRINWKKIIDLQPEAIAMVPIILAEPVFARFLRLVLTLDLSDYTKATIWELKVYDRFGPFGKAEKMLANQKTMRERIGVNGFWGWGFNTFSDNIPPTQGADKYFKVGNLARSYHNMNWDIIKPGDKANYDEMEKKGTNVHDWLNWDREYSDWKKAGFKIDASIQFQQLTVPETLWKNPIENAYQYGYEFADHFGNKHDLIDLVEIGNEPWDYPEGFYNQILEGMANGIKAAKSKIQVYPAAFQATFKAYERHEYDNYIGSKLNLTVLKNLDGLNGHFYSHTFNEKGNRISVNPEDPRSDLLGIRNLSKFRNINLPGKPLIITEFGYDSDGGDESCDHQECVTENQQAAWGLRAALMLLRNNADAVYWYFFANENRNSMLHSRSGLCSSANKSFIPKKSYRVFSEFQELLGNCTLKEILIESPEYYCYLFEDQMNKNKFAVIWSISKNNPDERIAIKYLFPSVPVSINYLDDNLSWLPLNADNQEIELFINGFPTVVQLK